MDEAQARAECERLAARHPDRATHQWRPREEAGGTWSVLKIALPPAQPTTAETRAEEKPPTADDPRSSAMQNIGPNVGPGI